MATWEKNIKLNGQRVLQLKLSVSVKSSTQAVPPPDTDLLISKFGSAKFGSSKFGGIVQATNVPNNTWDNQNKPT